jgi:hypothetical protein
VGVLEAVAPVSGHVATDVREERAIGQRDALEPGAAEREPLGLRRHFEADALDQRGQHVHVVHELVGASRIETRRDEDHGDVCHPGTRRAAM